MSFNILFAVCSFSDSMPFSIPRSIPFSTPILIYLIVKPETSISSSRFLSIFVISIFSLSIICIVSSLLSKNEYLIYFSNPLLGNEITSSRYGYYLDFSNPFLPEQVYYSVNIDPLLKLTFISLKCLRPAFDASFIISL
jgi:hypothetical protein